MVFLFTNTGGNTMNEDQKAKYWKPMVDHIFNTWKEKKGFGYMFTGRDFRDLKNAVRIYDEWGVMSLWDIYLEQNHNEVIQKSGFSLSMFFRCLCWLVDNPRWKALAKRYEKEMCPPPDQWMEEAIKSLKVGVI